MTSDVGPAGQLLRGGLSNLFQRAWRVFRVGGASLTMHKRTTDLLCALALLAISGCGPGASGVDGEGAAAVSLLGTTWQIEDIDEAGIVDRSMITLQFPETGRVAGSTGCNRYFGSVSIDGERLSFSQLGSTRRACAPAIAAQEQRFLEAVQAVARYRIETPEILILLDEAGDERLKGLRLENDPSADDDAGNQPQDQAARAPTRFDCGSAGVVAIRFPGPDTIEAVRDDTRAVLTRERSASGARYRGNGIEFWNKGDEAMLEIDGDRVSCARTK